MSEDSILDLRARFRQIANDGDVFFKKAAREQPSPDKAPLGYSTEYDPDTYWNPLTPSTKEQSKDIVSRVLHNCAALARAARNSPLTGPEDVDDIRVAAKAISDALKLREYWFRDAEAIHDEGTVLGIRKAEQSDRQCSLPNSAHDAFARNLTRIASVLKLVEVGGEKSGPQEQSTLGASGKYRPGSAFIMMWMDPNNPELTDVADTVRGVFQEFGFRANRADDIQHEGQISDRILNEIKTAEILFADLSGTRPNVYYEVGFAHALNKRVILFRKAGTPIHFDLAGYNCPEYINQHDLREKLTKRLISLTNRNPTEEPKL